MPEEPVDRVHIGLVEHYNSHAWNSRGYEGLYSPLFDRWPMVVQLSVRVKLE